MNCRIVDLLNLFSKKENKNQYLSKSTTQQFLPLFFIFIFFLFLPKFSEAQLSFGMQADYQRAYPFSFTNTNPKDTVVSLRKKLTRPQKATIMSACLPGLGQIYNKKYWKLPIIYAGFGGLGYAFWWNESYVKDYKEALHIRYDGDTSTHDKYERRYSDGDLVTLKNYYQRYRDLSVIGMAALYTLQVVDATVDAHLSTFDVSDDLSLHISPVLYPTSSGVCGLVNLRFGFK